MLTNDGRYRIFDRPKRADGLGHSREWIVVDTQKGWATVGRGDTKEEAIKDAESHQVD